MHGISNRDTHFVPGAQQLMSSSDDNNRSAVGCRKVGIHYETLYFHPRPTHLEWRCQEQRAVVQPECSRRGHGPLRNKPDKIFTGA